MLLHYRVWVGVVVVVCFRQSRPHELEWINCNVLLSGNEIKHGQRRTHLFKKGKQLTTWQTNDKIYSIDEPVISGMMGKVCHFKWVSHDVQVSTCVTLMSSTNSTVVSSWFDSNLHKFTLGQGLRVRCNSHKVTDTLFTPLIRRINASNVWSIRTSFDGDDEDDDAKSVNFSQPVSSRHMFDVELNIHLFVIVMFAEQL